MRVENAQAGLFGVGTVVRVTSDPTGRKKANNECWTDAVQTVERLYSVHDLHQFCLFLELSAPFLLGGMTSYTHYTEWRLAFFSFNLWKRNSIGYIVLKIWSHFSFSFPLFRYTIQTKAPSHDLLYNVRVNWGQQNCVNKDQRTMYLIF